MKKLFALVALLSLVSMAHANYWAIMWQIGGAYSPNDSTKGVLEDYSVTWGLWNATDDVLIAEMTAAAGSDEISIVDPFTTDTLLYDAMLRPDDSTTYFGDAGTKTGLYDVYQYVYLDNGTDKYEWKSDVSTIEIATSTMAAGQPIAGDTALLGRDTAWTKTSGVPEPATMSLLGLGALAMALRRKLRK